MVMIPPWSVAACALVKTGPGTASGAFAAIAVETAAQYIRALRFLADAGPLLPAPAVLKRRSQPMRSPTLSSLLSFVRPLVLPLGLALAVGCAGVKPMSSTTGAGGSGNGKGGNGGSFGNGGTVRNGGTGPVPITPITGSYTCTDFDTSGACAMFDTGKEGTLDGGGSGAAPSIA